MNVLTASDGGEAVRALSTQRPDLVLLDLGLPVMPGLAVLQHIRADPRLKHLPVIILSAEGERDRIVEAVRLGVSGYLLKSQFSLKVMLESVTRVLVATDSIVAGEGSVEPAPRAADAEPPIAAGKPGGPREPRPAGGAAVPECGGPTIPALAKPRKHEAGRNCPAERVALSLGSNLKSLRPLMTRSELLDRMSTDGELTGFSPTVSQVLKITASSACSMDQVAKAVGQDHAIALKVLKIANSSVYSRGDRVDTVHKAVLRIGMQNIRQAVLNIGVVERFGAVAFERHLSTPMFWEHSIACGIIAAELAHALRHAEPDIAFTAGLLHDLGRVLYAERLGEQYTAVLEAAQSLQLPLEQVESRLLFMNHAEVMDKVLHAWKFPKDLVIPIMFHHVAPGDIKSVAARQVTEVLRLGLADRLAHAMMLGSSGNDTIYPTEEHCRLLGIEPEMLRRIEEAAHQKTDDTKFALLSTSNGAAWPRCAERYRGTMTAPFRPLFVSAAPEMDAYRIFCREFAGQSDEPPNIAVLHIAAPKDRITIHELLGGAERDAGVQGLPVLMLSPGGQLVLDSNAIAGRKWQALSTPLPVSRFIAAVNALVVADSAQRAA